MPNVRIIDLTGSKLDAVQANSLLRVRILCGHVTVALISGPTRLDTPATKVLLT